MQLLSLQGAAHARKLCKYHDCGSRLCMLTRMAWVKPAAATADMTRTLARLPLEQRAVSPASPCMHKLRPADSVVCISTLVKAVAFLPEAHTYPEIQQTVQGSEVTMAL